MNNIISFGEWVQGRRNQLGLSRTSLVRLISCSPVTIKKIERDERRPLTPPIRWSGGWQTEREAILQICHLVAGMPYVGPKS